MADIYGEITEHPEVPITDPGRFTVVIKPHDFEARGRDAYDRSFCGRCGFTRVAPIHPKENDRG